MLKATKENIAIAKFILKKGEGIHPIAFKVKNIHQAMKDMARKVFQLLNETPRRSADNRLVCFIQPKSANSVLAELCQSIEKI